MSARSVYSRLGCLVFGAALTMNAQFVDDNYRRYAAPGPDPGMNPLMVDGTIPDIPDNTRIPSATDGTISVNRLSHKVPGKAAKEYAKATDCRAKHKYEQALAHFQKALQIDPEFVEAANDAAASYADLNRTDEAQAAFERVIKIDPHYWNGYFNLSIMYIINGHYADAERSARRAADLNRTAIGNRLLLGMALVLQDKFTDEAVRNLTDSREQYPQAHLFLARALAGRGKRDLARTEVQKFLNTPQKDQTAKHLAESWLQALR